MPIERRQRIEEIFQAALDREPEVRGRFLEDACRGDAALRASVEELLDCDAAAEGFLESPFSTSGTDAPDPLIGQRIGRYQIEGLIAVGGMGAVYRARQDRPDRTVALKLIRSSFPSRTARQRFAHEAEILARLRHHGIAHVYEAGTHRAGMATLPYFVMELLDRARPLTVYAREEGLTVRQRLELFVAVCDAVHHGHQHGIIHRDLKPGNILVLPSGRPKVIDFGVARMTDSDVTLLTTRSDSGQLLGTLRYMSPEQSRGESTDIDVRSDVYALGVVLFELLVDRLPYDLTDSSPFEVPRIIREVEPRRLSSIDRSLTGDIETIVHKALEKEPGRRYGSVFELAQDIQRFLCNEPILARPATTLYQLCRFARRNRALVSALAVVLLALVSAVVVISISLVRTTDAEQKARSRLEEAERESAKARAFADSLRRLIRSASPDIARGRDVSLLREMLERAARDAETSFGDLPDVKAAIQQTIGETYYDLGLYDQAQPLLQSVFAERRRLFGDEHLDVADSLASLGALRYDRSDYEPAIDAYRRALAIQRKLLPPADPRLLDTMERLARALVDSSVPANRLEAERICRQLLTRERELFPDRSEEVASTLSVLGDALCDEGKLEEAETVLRGAAETQEALLGENSTALASTLVGLGRVQRLAGKSAEAEKTLRRVLRIRRHLLGDRHTALAWPAFQLALVLTEQERFDEAETLCREAVAIQIDGFGPDHPEVTSGMQRLADLLAARGDHERARAIYEDVLERLRRRPGDHWLVSECQVKLEALARRR